jgi:hypothetical protein
MVAFLTRSGFTQAGTTRGANPIIETAFFAAGKKTNAFGAAVRMSAGKIEKFEAGDLASDFYGVVVRDIPSESGTLAADLAFGGSPSEDRAQGVLTQGFISVVCAQGTPIRSNPVYIRTVVDTGKAIGDFEADFDGTATSAATGGNTGNGTMGAITVTSGAPTSAVTCLFTAATRFNVTLASGEILGVGTTGVDFSTGGLSFKITAGGTAFVVGDSFVITTVIKNEALSGVEWSLDDKDASNLAEIRVNV